ncbi:MAG TPA: LppX_LprAFG lipoprotein [Roseiflexaceae bacterium]|nr:LppX_LprAFG lipoprotein [Roseiflexaceae bacterium]
MRALRRFIITAALLLAACAPGAPASTPTPTPTPAEIAAGVGRATQQAQSLRFAVTVTGRPVFTDASRLFALTAMEGALRRPDGVLATLRLRGAAGLVEVRTVSLASRQYLTNPLTRAWQCVAPGAAFDPAVLFAPDTGIEALLQDGLRDVALAGEEQVDGRASYRLRATVDGARLAAVSGGLLGAGPVAAEIWADKATLRASRIVLVDSATDPADPTTWTMTFSGYDEPVDVRAPVEC